MVNVGDIWCLLKNFSVSSALGWPFSSDISVAAKPPVTNNVSNPSAMPPLISVLIFFKFEISSVQMMILKYFLNEH